MLNSATKRLNLSRSIMKLEKYDFALGLSRKLSSSQVEMIISFLNRAGFKHLLVNDQKLSKFSILLIYYRNPENMLKQAEKLFLLKKVINQNHTSPLKQSSIRQLIKKKGAENLDPRVKELEKMARFTFAQRKDFLKVFSHSLQRSRSPSPSRSQQSPDKEREKGLSLSSFTSGNLISKQFSNTPIKRHGDLEYKQSDNNLNLKKEPKTLFSSLANKVESPITSSFDVVDNQENMEDYLNIFSPSELCRIIWTLLVSVEINTSDPGFIETFKIEGNPQDRFINTKLIDILRTLKVLKFVSPLHTEDPGNVKNIESLTNYFGTNVGIYFEFMVFYMKWLIVPALFGIFINYLVPEHNSSLRVWFDIAYCLMIMVWATLFVRFWERRTSELSVQWGTYGSQFRIANTRYDFKGKFRINPITELPEFYYPKKMKILLYIRSFFLHLPLVCLSLYISIICLNIKGNVLSDHWIYISSLSRLTEPGGIFEKKSKLISFFVTISEMFIKIFLGNLNVALSQKTNVWENHRTHVSYNNSLITKRFVFGIVNKFLYLVYLAFWRLDIEALRTQLSALFTFDEVRRLIKESITPYIILKMKEKKIKRNPKPNKLDSKQEGTRETVGNASRQGQSLRDYVVEKANELNESEYNSFEDYYEMIMQFGYITLFAAAFPLSGALSLLFNVFEVFSDSFKLKYTVRRPLPEAVNGIGSWFSSLKVMSFLCIITNSILIAYRVEFKTAIIEQLSPQSVDNMEGQMLGIVFVTEHVMLAIVYALRTIVKSHPSWVRVYVKRKFGKTSGLWQ